MSPIHKGRRREARARPSRVVALAFGITLFVCVLYWSRADRRDLDEGSRRWRNRSLVPGGIPEITVNEIWRPYRLDVVYTDRPTPWLSLRIVLPTTARGEILPPVAQIRSGVEQPVPRRRRATRRFRPIRPVLYPFYQN